MTKCLPLLLLPLALSACTATGVESSYNSGGYYNDSSGQPYPGGGGPGHHDHDGPRHDPLAAADALNASIARMYDSLDQYDPDAYANLRRDLRNLGKQTNDVQDLLRRNERQSRVREQFRDVERAASTIDNGLRTASVNRGVRESWGDILANVQNTARILDRGDSYGGGYNPGPFPPAGGGGGRPPVDNGPGHGNPGGGNPHPQNPANEQPVNPNAPVIAAGDQLVGSIDIYVQATRNSTGQDALALRGTLNALRINSDNFRKFARAGASHDDLRNASNNLTNEFNTANQQYQRLIAGDPRSKTDLFGKIGQAIASVQQSVR